MVRGGLSALTRAANMSQSSAKMGSFVLYRAKKRKPTLTTLRPKKVPVRAEMPLAEVSDMANGEWMVMRPRSSLSGQHESTGKR